MSARRSRLVCAGCGAEPARGRPVSVPLPERGPRRRRRPRPSPRARPRRGRASPPDDDEPNPFVRYRRLLHAYHVGARRRHGRRRVLRARPRARRRASRPSTATASRRRRSSAATALSDRLGFSAHGGVWVKDETGNVSGSHKARHLFGVLALARGGGAARPRRPERAARPRDRELRQRRARGRRRRGRRRSGASASSSPRTPTRWCWRGSRSSARSSTVCPREPGVAGDPTVHALTEALAAGALPFTCQGNLNGLAVEGGETLALGDRRGGRARRPARRPGRRRRARERVRPRLREAAALGAIELDAAHRHRPDPRRVAAEARVRPRRGARRRRRRGRATRRTHRSEFMWPWEDEPHSVAHGILDDETYDWLAVVEGMLATGGAPVVAGEDDAQPANELARDATGIDVDPTGSAGSRRPARPARATASSATTSESQCCSPASSRSHQSETRGIDRDAELPGSRHPVAQGL